MFQAKYEAEWSESSWCGKFAKFYQSTFIVNTKYFTFLDIALSLYVIILSLIGIGKEYIKWYTIELFAASLINAVALLITCTVAQTRFASNSL